MSELKNTHHLTEVLCGLWFDPKSNMWDSTFFGKYHEKIEKLGYTERQEQKGVQIKFELKADAGKAMPTSEMNEMEPRMVFKDLKNNYATLMAANFISFHKLEPYKSWEKLIEEQVAPGMKEYKEIGLGNNIVQVQALYLNKYVLNTDEKLSDYFSFIPAIQDFGSGIESNLGFQSQYELEPNLMQQIKLNSVIDPVTNTKNVFLECSCFAFVHEGKGWEDLSKQAHDQNNVVFKKITKK
jgi:uncharacterized protein (TIGR04255 family)